MWLFKSAVSACNEKEEKMKKRNKFGFVFVSFVLFCLLNVFATTAVCGEEPIKLSFANFFPPSHFTNTVQFPNWIKDIEQATGGRVKITNYPGQTLLSGREMFDGVVQGTADLSHGSTGYSRGRFPVTANPKCSYRDCAAWFEARTSRITFE